MIKKIIAVSTVFFIGLSSLAYSVTSKPKEKIGKIVELSGLAATINSLPAQLEAQLKQRQLISENPELDQFVVENLVSSFDTKRANEITVLYFKRLTEDRMVNDLLTWYNNRLGRKI